MASYDEIRFIEFIAGTSIEEACEEALKLSIYKSCIVKFDFNGAEMRVYPTLFWKTSKEKVDELVNEYHQKIKTKKGEWK